jgi:hypothetical protein
MDVYWGSRRSADEVTDPAEALRWLADHAAIAHEGP